MPTEFSTSNTGSYTFAASEPCCVRCVKLARAEFSRACSEEFELVVSIASSTTVLARSISTLAASIFDCAMRCETTVASVNPRTSITTADTKSTVPTNRTCREVRHASATRSPARLIGFAASGYTSVLPVLYPTPRTVRMISGFSGSRSILERSRWTWTLTSRVSGALR